MVNTRSNGTGIKASLYIHILPLLVSGGLTQGIGAQKISVGSCEDLVRINVQ